MFLCNWRFRFDDQWSEGFMLQVWSLWEKGCSSELWFQKARVEKCLKSYIPKYVAAHNLFEERLMWTDLSWMDIRTVFTLKITYNSWNDRNLEIKIGSLRNCNWKFWKNSSLSLKSFGYLRNSEDNDSTFLIIWLDYWEEVDTNVLHCFSTFSNYRTFQSTFCFLNPEFRVSSHSKTNKKCCILIIVFFLK